MLCCCFSEVMSNLIWLVSWWFYVECWVEDSIAVTNAFNKKHQLSASKCVNYFYILLDLLMGLTVQHDIENDNNKFITPNWCHTIRHLAEMFRCSQATTLHPGITRSWGSRIDSWYFKTSAFMLYWTPQCPDMDWKITLERLFNVWTTLTLPR